MWLTAICVLLANVVYGDRSEDVYGPFFQKPYDASSCEGKPHGCAKVIKVLQNYEREITDLRNKLSKEQAEGKKKQKEKENKRAPEKMGKPVDLNDNTFTDYIKGSEDPSLVLFYADWCGHCKNMMPDYKKLAALMQEKTVNIVRVDAIANQTLAKKFKVQGFPTIIFFEKGGKPRKYNMGRDVDSFVKFLQPYAKDRISEPVTLKQLINEQQFKAACADAPCIITVLAHLMDGGQAAGRNKALKNIENAINADPSALRKFHVFWMEAGTNLDWEESIFGSIGYPTTIAIDLSKKSVGIFKKNNTDEKELADFFKKYTTGRIPGDRYRRDEIPELKAMTPWDGKDFSLDQEL